VWRGAAAARPLYSASNAVDINILCHLISTGTMSTGTVKNGGYPIPRKADLAMVVAL
jgi:hypothetical protein